MVILNVGKEEERAEKEEGGSGSESDVWSNYNGAPDSTQIVSECSVGGNLDREIEDKFQNFYMIAHLASDSVNKKAERNFDAG